MSSRDYTPAPGYEETRPGVNGPIETPAGYLARGEGLTLYCRKRGCPSNNLGKPVNFAAYIAKGWADVPLAALKARWVCDDCGAKDFQTIRSPNVRLGLDGNWSEGPD